MSISQMLAFQTLDPILASNPSYLIDPENPDPTSTLVDDIVQASSVKKKRDTLTSGVTPKSSVGSGIKRNSLTENVGRGDDYTAKYSSSDNEDTAKGKNANKAEEENDWIIGNADILKSKEVKPKKSKSSSSKSSKSKSKKKTKKPKNKANKMKLISSKAQVKGSEASGNKKSHQNHEKEKSLESSNEDDDDWIMGTTDVITEYLKKKKELELKKKDDLLATNSGSGSGEGSGSGSGEFQYTVKPYSALTEEKEHAHHQKGQEQPEMMVRQSEKIQNDLSTKASNQTLLKDSMEHQQDDLPKQANQTLLKDLIHQQEEAQHNQQQQMEPETLKELVAPLQTANISKNESANLMNHLADKVVENPNLRNDYLFQLTHQEPVGLVGTHNEVESVTVAGGGSTNDPSSVVTGSVRGQIQGEDDKEVGVTKKGK